MADELTLSSSLAPSEAQEPQAWGAPAPVESGEGDWQTRDADTEDGMSLAAHEGWNSYGLWDNYVGHAWRVKWWRELEVEQPLVAARMVAKWPERYPIRPHEEADRETVDPWRNR